jgi:hypothetical protein
MVMKRAAVIAGCLALAMASAFGQGSTPIRNLKLTTDADGGRNGFNNLKNVQLRSPYDPETFAEIVTRIYPEKIFAQKMMAYPGNMPGIQNEEYTFFGGDNKIVRAFELRYAIDNIPLPDLSSRPDFPQVTNIVNNAILHVSAPTIVRDGVAYRQYWDNDLQTTAWEPVP